MKVETLLTIRLTPETRQEMISTYPAAYRELRQSMEAEIAAGTVLQIPATTQIRWILESGRWDA